MNVVNHMEQPLFRACLDNIWALVARGRISGMPDYKLVVALAAVTDSSLTTFAGGASSKKVDDPDTLGKVNLLIVSDYSRSLLLVVVLSRNFTVSCR